MTGKNDVRVLPEAVAAKIGGLPVRRVARIPPSLLKMLVEACVADYGGMPGNVALIDADQGPLDVARSLAHRLVGIEREAREEAAAERSLVERCNRDYGNIARQKAETLAQCERDQKDNLARADAATRKEAELLRKADAAREALDMLISDAGIEVREEPVR